MIIIDIQNKGSDRYPLRFHYDEDRERAFTEFANHTRSGEFKTYSLNEFLFYIHEQISKEISWNNWSSITLLIRTGIEDRNEKYFSIVDNTLVDNY